ncbi:MAG: hypothetical protein U9O53_06330, partial [archaeon]|nr:hypothetical protein [archaeon]
MIAFLLVFSSLAYLFLDNGTNTISAKTSRITPTTASATPHSATAKSPLVGSSSFSQATAPTMVNATVDPTKVWPGDMMHVSAEVKDDSGISSVTAEMPHEGGSDILNLSLSEGTIYGGIWEDDWLVHDTLVKNYTTTVTATNINGISSTAEIEWSDPPTTPPKLNFTSPTEPNGTTISRNWTEANITIDELNLDTFKFNWNNTN